MGQRISYFKNNSNKGLKELIFENYSAFQQWYLDTDKSSWKEFNEPFGNENLKNHFKQDTSIITNFDNLEKKLIDELTSEFIGSYHDLSDTNNKILEFFGPSISKWRYTKSSEMVTATNNQEFIRLWNFLITGRSLKDNEKFDSYSNEYKIGYLTFEEHRKLKNYIEAQFGDTNKIKDQYWTFGEKLKEKIAIIKSTSETYSLSGHNPESTGLECVLQALIEMGDNKGDLITGIE